MDQRGFKPRKQLGRLRTVECSTAILEQLVQRGTASQISIKTKLLSPFSVFTDGWGWGIKSNSIKEIPINKSKHQKIQNPQRWDSVMNWLSGKPRSSKSSHFLNEGTLK